MPALISHDIWNSRQRCLDLPDGVMRPWGWRQSHAGKPSPKPTTAPSSMDQILNDWLFAHHFEEDSPFADGLDSAFPSYCSIAN